MKWKFWSECKCQIINIKQAKENLEVEEIRVVIPQALPLVADAGYDSNEEIANCEKNGISAIVSKVKLGRAPDKNYNKEHFTYDENNDEYISPEGQKLTLQNLYSKMLD